jgi:hypothetical protein
MKTLEFMNPAHLFVEIGQDRFKAYNGTSALDLALDRMADGRLTESCKNNLALELQRHINRKSWQPRPRAFCAIGARGVSLRRLSLPAASSEELHRLLPLQIENEFPLPPDQLAWGFQTLNDRKASPGSSNGKQELLVAAVKKDSLEEYAGIFLKCGATPVFTLAALARSYVCPQSPGPYAVLALERNHSELITIDEGVPVAVRVLPWGIENLARVRQQVGRDNPGEAAALLGQSSQEASFGGSGASRAERISANAVEPLAALINGQAVGRRIYVLGAADWQADFDFANQLGTRLGNGVDCQVVEIDLGKSGSAAILGLQKTVERENGWPPLVLQAKQSNGKAARFVQEAPLKWAGTAVGLLVLALLLPYAEALLLKSHVATKLAAIRTDQGRLVTMDRELDFLEYLQQNEPPYLDALLALSKAAPPGTRFDSVTMSRRGEISLRGSLHDGQQVADLRAKLIDSGFFESVSIEEQTPTPDHQKVNVRMNAQWKPLDRRITPSLEPGRKSTEPKPAASQMPSGASPGNAAQRPAPKSAAQIGKE